MKNRIQNYGVSRLPKNATKAQYLEQVSAVQKFIKNKRPRGVALRRAREYICNMQSRMDRVFGIKNESEKSQMILPGFLSGEQIVYFEELIANRIEKAVSKALVASKKKAKKATKKTTKKTTKKAA